MSTPDYRTDYHKLKYSCIIEAEKYKSQMEKDLHFASMTSFKYGLFYGFLIGAPLGMVIAVFIFKMGYAL